MTTDEKDAIPEWLLDILVCPIRKDLKLRLVQGESLAGINRRIAGGEVKDHGGRRLGEPLVQALVREDGELLYPVKDGIPHLLVDCAVDLETGDVD